ncbi:PAS domain-containing sensor histidine kinase [Sulfuricurvum sp.]|uniref:sensor histidine kinase n=1 Tax=Sulfuricurvum sp. TaxID=2025608 RepID=UPI0026313F62|nr:PAS domain-containing sensor histidine kinase [Sulfuricurvum sp.]MDD2267816.1 PAS domain-containing sensor histidine kinase [Sulfuricurvum sp.]MDD2783506.1 PAS domain-containing sensor histidine kinase [Sulfuricurvum sp.]
MSELPYHRLLIRQMRRFVRPELVEELTPFLESINTFYEDADKERKLLEHTLDVSSKELEDANRSLMQRHKEMHDSILNALSVGLFAVDIKGNVIFANESASSMLGRNEAQLIGHNIETFLQDSDIAEIIKYGAGFGRKEGETQIFGAEGKIIPIRFSAYPIMEGDTPKGIVFSFSDITLDQKRQELIDLQQLALESTATMMLIADSHGNIQYANGEYLRFSGYDQEEIVGKKSHFIADEQINDPSLIQECWKTVKSGHVWDGELLAQIKSGTIYFEELTVTPLIERGKVTHVVAVKKNISERIRAQEELKLARDEAIMAMNQAKEANLAKDTFLSNMSHELRTPLNAILGFSQILMAKPDTSSAAKMFIEKILISGRNLLSLVNTILDFSKIEAGKMEVHKTLFPLYDLIDEVNILTEPMADKKGLKRSFKIDIGASVYADRQLIKQVLINLLSNAIKFSPENETITLEFTHEIDRETFCISDHGYGIAQEKISTLFDPFVQIREHQNDAIKGTGLGLTIVKKIIELHGGTIWVESIVGKGSRFYFSLPKPEM